MVAAFVVVRRSAVVCVLAAVPGIRKRRHGFGLFAVEFHQEILADRAAVAVHAASVEVQGACKQAFVACHNVCEVSQALRRVTIGSDVNVNSAAPCCVALCTRFPKSADKFLQGFHVLVGENRGNHFAFLAVGSRNAHVLLKLPLATLAVPCGVGAVAVAVCGVLVAASSEKVCGNLRRLGSCYAVHFNLDPYGLVHHFFNLLGGFLVHCGVLRLLCFPF